MSDVVNLDAVADLLETHAQLVEAHLDPERRQRVVAEKLADYAEGGRWAYAPAEAKRNARAKVEGEIASTVGHALWHAEMTAKQQAAVIEAAIERAQEPLTPEAAWLARTKTGGMSGAESVQLGILDELRQSRFTRELDTALPSLVLARYEVALAASYEQDHATLIKVVEERFRGGWAGNGRDLPGDKDHPEVAAAARLHARIRGTREGRIPPAALRARAGLAGVGTVAQRAKTLHGFEAVRPR